MKRSRGNLPWAVCGGLALSVLLAGCATQQTAQRQGSGRTGTGTPGTSHTASTSQKPVTSLNVLLGRLQAHDHDVRIAAARQIGEIGGPAAGPVIDLLKRQLAKQQQAYAAWKDGFMRQTPDGRVIMDMNAAVRADREKAILIDIGVAVREIGEAATPEVLALLESSDPELVHIGIQLLGDIATPSDDRVATLSGFLNPSDWKACRFAAIAIGKWGPGASGAVGPLSALLSVQAEDIRKAAEQAGEDTGSLAFAMNVDKIAGMIKEEAARALGKIGASSRGALPDLRRLTEDKAENVVAAATEAITLIETRE